MIGTNITRPTSKYIGHHAIALLEMKDDDTVIVVDRDDTVDGDGVLFEVNVEELIKAARPPFNKNLEGDSVQVDAMLRQPDEGTNWCTIL